MNEKDLSKDNSKKLIIGISIFFCAVILIIGATTAYFTQSDTKETGNIVSTNQVTLHYADNDHYMLGNLIPINEDKVEYAYNREGNLKCKDDAGYNVCSIYQFTITNTGNVVQDIIINLETKVNGFTNLKFKLYDLATNNEVPIEKNSLSYNTEEEILLVNDLTLDTSNNKSNTYELVFYILNDKDNDQSHLDSGKRFGAKIKVNSITTGTYIEEGFGEEDDCWILDDTKTKLTAFNGLTEDGLSVRNECKKYFKEDEETEGAYIVNIPSKYNNNNITTIGNMLFFPMNMQTGDFIDIYGKVKQFNIESGITEIEDGDEELKAGAFYAIGRIRKDGDMNDWPSNFEDGVTFNLPDSLEKIGSYTFAYGAIKSINLPSNLKEIGNNAFEKSLLTSIEIPYSVTKIGMEAFDYTQSLTQLTFLGNLEDSNNNKLTIGEFAFSVTSLTYDASNPLKLPARISKIETNAFKPIDELDVIKFMGKRAELNKLGTIWYSTNTSVTAIDD